MFSANFWDAVCKQVTAAGPLVESESHGKQQTTVQTFSYHRPHHCCLMTPLFSLSNLSEGLPNLPHLGPSNTALTKWCIELMVQFQKKNIAIWQPPNNDKHFINILINNDKQCAIFKLKVLIEVRRRPKWYNFLNHDLVASSKPATLAASALSWHRPVCHVNIFWPTALRL